MSSAVAGTRSDRAVFVGLDLGTSGLKGLALTGSGAVVARASAGYPTARPEAGAAEQDPDDWLAAIWTVAAALAADADPASWSAIGLSAMLPTLVTAQADGTPAGPAITWEDGRAEHQAERLRELIPGEQLYRITGQRVDGRYLLPMYARLAEVEPDQAGATVMLLGAKDYVFGWLTGEAATDPSTATGFGCYDLATGQWDGRVLAAARRALPGRPELPALPQVLPATATRTLRAELAARLGCGTIPVCAGAADSVLGALGLGASSPGQVAYVAGTSTVILGVAAEPKLDERHRFLVTPLAEPGRWGLEMDLLATGSAVRWLAGLLGGGLDEAGVVALAARTDPAAAPVVLPYLSPGEQGALWDPDLRGTIAGLTLGHGREHLARGLVNGIVLESRRCLDVLDAAGAFGASLLVAGGSAVEPSFRADLADATGRQVLAPDRDDTDFSAFGAARLAAQAIGSPLPADARPHAQLTQPDPGRRAMWDELWLTHERTRLLVPRD